MSQGQLQTRESETSKLSRHADVTPKVAQIRRPARSSNMFESTGLSKMLWVCLLTQLVIVQTLASGVVEFELLEGGMAPGLSSGESNSRSDTPLRLTICLRLTSEAATSQPSGPCALENVSLAWNHQHPYQRYDSMAAEKESNLSTSNKLPSNSSEARQEEAAKESARAKAQLERQEIRKIARIPFALGWTVSRQQAT